MNYSYEKFSVTKNFKVSPLKIPYFLLIFTIPLLNNVSHICVGTLQLRSVHHLVNDLKSIPDHFKY